MKKLYFVVCGVFYIALMLGCASMDRSTSIDREYFSSVKEFTDRTEYYSGFINVFQAQATVLNSKVRTGQIEKKAQSFSWTDEQKNQEHAKVDSSLRSETVIFLSFFTPQNKLNNLDSPSSVWRVFLDVNNKRYVGAVSTYVGIPNEVQLFYPYHSGFSKAYLVKFPVPMAHIQDYPMSLTITGTVGSDTLKLKALK